MRTKRKPYTSHKKLMTLLLVCAIVFSSQGELFAAKGEAFLNDTYIADLNLKKEINRTLNLEIEQENVEIARLQKQSITENVEEKNDMPIPNPPEAELKELRAESQEITQEDLAKLTSLDASNKQIQSIAGLEYAINLKTVNLDGNEISDISPLGSISELQSFSANGQRIKGEEKETNESSLSIPNLLKGFENEVVVEVMGEGVKAQENEIVLSNLTNGQQERTISFEKQYTKGSFSGTFTQSVKAEIGKEEAGKREEPEKSQETPEKESYLRSSRSIPSAPSSSARDVQKIQSWYLSTQGTMSVKWDPVQKRLWGVSHGGAGLWGHGQTIDSGVLRPQDEGQNWSNNGGLSRRFLELGSNGEFTVRSLGEDWTQGAYSSFSFDAPTGSVIKIWKGDGNWTGRVNENLQHFVNYTQPGETWVSEYYRVLADGKWRAESSIYRHQNTLSSELLRYSGSSQGMSIKSYYNSMLVLSDESTQYMGTHNKQILIQAFHSNGTKLFEGVTRVGRSYYESFKDIQGIKWNNDYRLVISNLTTKERESYKYVYSSDMFIKETSITSVPDDTYMIQMVGANGNDGYSILIENGKIANVFDNGYGKVLQGSYNGKVLYSLGIFKPNGDLKKKVKIMGGNHTINSTTGEINGLKNYQFEDGDELVLYAIKNLDWDESSKIRILGNVENSTVNWKEYGDKGILNEVIFRYDGATKTFAQTDGTISGMDSKLKTKLESIMSSAPFSNLIQSNGNKKAWLLGLGKDNNEEIKFDRGDLTKLTGMEYVVNVTNLNISDNPYDLNTYHSLRNSKDLIKFQSTGIGMEGQEEKVVDVLVNFTNLTNLDLSNNRIADTSQIARLNNQTLKVLKLSENNISDATPLKVYNKLQDLYLDKNKIQNVEFLNGVMHSSTIKNINLDYNEIEDLSPASNAWDVMSPLMSLYVRNQSIKRPKQTMLTTESYEENIQAKTIEHKLLNQNGISGISPSGKGQISADGKIKWANLNTSTKELSYKFADPKTAYYKTNIEFSGTVTIPVDVAVQTTLKVTSRSTGGKVDVFVDGVKKQTVPEGSYVTYPVLSGQEIRLEPYATRDRYHFYAWEDGTKDAPKTFIMPETNVSQVAIFLPGYTITFDPDGGTFADGTTTAKSYFVPEGLQLSDVLSADEINNLNVQHSDYNFDKWDPSWKISDMLTEDKTVKAIWQYKNAPITLIEIPKGIDLKSNGSGELVGTGSIRTLSSIDQNLSYKNMIVKATPNIQLTSPGITDVYEVSVWKKDGSQYTDGTQPLGYLHPKGELHPKQVDFTLKSPHTSLKKKGKYTGNMIFQFSWE